MTTSTITCPDRVPWCTDHDEHFNNLRDPADGLITTHWTQPRTVDTLPETDDPGEIRVLVTQFSCQGSRDARDNVADAPEVWVGDSHLSPAAARELAAVLLELANAAEAGT